MALCSDGRCFAARKLLWSDTTYVIVTGVDLYPGLSNCKAYGRYFCNNSYRDGLISGSGSQVWGLYFFLDAPLLIRYL